MNKFKINDKVKVIADKERLEDCFADELLTGKMGVIVDIKNDEPTSYRVEIDGVGWWLAEQDIALACITASATCTVHTVEHPDGKKYEVVHTVEQPDGELEVKEPPVRTFGMGATMTLKRFDTLVDYIVEKRIKAVMCAKSAEYAQGGNKLHNFDRAGKMRGISPMEALRGMKLKHEVSIQDMLDKLKEGKTYSRELWEEKFTDNINYQILQWAILARDDGWNEPVDHTKPVPGEN